ncbi:hypothetical protein [Desulfosporosinus meridiei]|uniref:Uncharacterized protein n=1 Tax=Desulfosporosinus meridiei (strain ATCC BAA-275 / DSM 13257 / KCTC 12902 / NCIMB 13706 / S10) TaxID=768704 RepID=J7IQ56_DESMD|nr:hypothetical protein [Desulfosporosinus meridiei]AFQ43992.1 hypothetical protein Desmer_2051 [Desulfosporosinus meridiei DSM 13257]
MGFLDILLELAMSIFSTGVSVGTSKKWYVNLIQYVLLLLFVVAVIYGLIILFI